MKPIYKRKWFLIAVGVAAFMVIGIISNLGESEEPAPRPTATPIVIPTPTQQELGFTLFESGVSQMIEEDDGVKIGDSEFDRFCYDFLNGEPMLLHSSLIAAAVDDAVEAAFEMELLEDSSAVAFATHWCENR